MFVNTEDELNTLGACLIEAQKIEYALYGIVSHLSHLKEAKKESRFKNLDPEKFLRGDIKELKATLGQIVAVFGKKLSLAGPELDKFIVDRNTIAHNYWRLTRCNDKEKINNPEEFLFDFLKNCIKWNQVVRGLLAIFRHAAAQEAGRTSELNIDDDLEVMTAYAIFADQQKQPKQ